MKTICIVSKNPIVYDERVKKEAVTLSKFGFKVFIICRKDFNIPKHNQEYKKTEFFYHTDFYEVINIPDYNEFQFNFQCFKIIKKINPHVVWCIDGNTMFCGFLVKHFLKNIVTVVDFHEIYYRRDTISNKKNKIRWEKFCEKTFAGSFDFYLSVSPLSSRVLVNDLKLKKFPLTIHNSPHFKNIDFNLKKEMRIKYGIPENRKIIIYEGIIFPGRGLEFLIKTLKKLEDYYIYLVGPDRYFGKFEKMVSEAGVESRVVKMPLMNHSEMMDFISIGDIGYIGTEPTCINHSYTLANKLYEYSMSGIPVLASNIPAYKKFVEDKEIGALFHFGDENSLISGVKKIESDRKNIIKNLVKFNKKYCWENQEKKINNILRNIKERNNFVFNDNYNITEYLNKVLPSEKKISDGIVIRSAPVNIFKMFFQNYRKEDFISVIQPDFENEIKTINNGIEYIFFPEKGFFCLKFIFHRDFLKKLKKTKKRNIVILNSTMTSSDKWKFFVFFKLLKFKIFKFNNLEIITDFKIFDLLPFYQSLRVLFK